MGARISRNKTKRKSTFREYAEAFVIAVILALFIRAFIIQAFKIPSGSMIPTLLVGDHILVNKFIYGVKIPFKRKPLIPISKPQRDDVIVFVYPKDRSKDYIKRVIGLPGDKIKIIGRKIYINGEPYSDKHGVYSDQRENLLRLLVRPNYGPITVPEGHLFVMGDNRDNSSDSRVWGFVPLDLVKGKALIIYWSWPHLSRFLHIIR